MEKDTDKYKKKSNYLNIKFKNEYEDREKMLEEKNKFEKILKAEITDLLQVWLFFFVLKNILMNTYT